MLNLNELNEEREKASIDKSDLFDFYNWAYDELVKEVEELRSKLKIATKK